MAQEAIVRLLLGAGADPRHVVDPDAHARVCRQRQCNHFAR